ncbi:hypothetical protein H4R34_001583 [Dimargaris verticillata]|uniref:Cyclin-like domain-containing protein n=1 Tax=Dimargaris verticillata TaxID=2761393 RepID=A0A9W8B578_9FUNG|nr:hypothetical protein H4R34_001583 [Dimargaris verticillata]
MLNKHSFDNPLLTNDQLVQSISQRCGLSAKLEQQLLQHGCELIQSAGIVLSLPQVAMASAQVLLWRFFHVCSLTEFSLRDVAMGCLFLASKVEESPRKIKDIINVFDYVIKKQRQHHHQQSAITPLEPFSQMFYDLKNGVTIAELQILRHLSFNVQVQLPYGLLVNYLQCLRLTSHSRVPQMAWNYLNDGLRTCIYVCYQPTTIACAVIFLAARQGQVKLPTKPAWWVVFGASLPDLYHISGHLLSLYAQPPPPGLPLTVEELLEYRNTLPS